MQLVLDTNGLAVKKRNKSFWIIGQGQQRIISPHRVTSIAVTADCLMSSAAIKLAAKHQIPIFFFNKAGKAEARLWSDSFGSIATIRRQQVLFAMTPEATEWIISLFELKTQHQRENLKYLSRRKPNLKQKLTHSMHQMESYSNTFAMHKLQLLSECRNNLMGIEGNIAKIYWHQLSLCLPEGLQFGTRSRRPAQDIFNAALNYLYGMLYNVVSSAILAAGLDPHLGFLHVDQHAKPTFTFDLIEPFRPWVDQLLLKQALAKKLKNDFFQQTADGYYLNKQGKRFLIPLFNEHMQNSTTFNHRRLNRKNHIYRFAGEFAQFLLKKAENKKTND